MCRAPYLAFQCVNFHDNDFSYPKQHLHNQYRNRHRRAFSAEIPKLHPGQDNLEVMHSFTSLSLKPHEMSPGDTGNRDETLWEGTSEVPFAYGICPYLGYPHPSIAVQEHWQTSSGKNLEIQPQFEMTLPSCSLCYCCLQDCHSLTLGRTHLHPCHFCPQDKTRCLSFPSRAQGPLGPLFTLCVELTTPDMLHTLDLHHLELHTNMSLSSPRLWKAWLLAPTSAPSPPTQKETQECLLWQPAHRAGAVHGRHAAPGLCLRHNHPQCREKCSLSPSSRFLRLFHYGSLSEVWKLNTKWENPVPSKWAHARKHPNSNSRTGECSHSAHADKELGSAPKARGEQQQQKFGNSISLPHRATTPGDPELLPTPEGCPATAGPRHAPSQPTAQPSQHRPTSLQLQECLWQSTQAFLIAGCLTLSVLTGCFFKVSFFVLRF